MDYTLKNHFVKEITLEANSYQHAINQLNYEGTKIGTFSPSIKEGLKPTKAQKEMLLKMYNENQLIRFDSVYNDYTFTSCKNKARLNVVENLIAKGFIYLRESGAYKGDFYAINPDFKKELQNLKELQDKDKKQDKKETKGKNYNN